MHSADDARAAVRIAERIFDRYSFDLIFGRQDQKLADWAEELQAALPMVGDHVSMYQLTIEPGTRFGEMFAIGKLAGLPDDDLGAEMYEMAVDAAETRGLGFYEVSNACGPGAQSRHNLTYWRAGTYLGTGPGAHGRVESGHVRHATESVRDPRTWLERAHGSHSVFETVAPLHAQDVATEYVLMALRLREGLSYRRLKHISGATLDLTALRDLFEDGLIEGNTNALACTEKGRMLLNAIVPDVVDALAFQALDNA